VIDLKLHLISDLPTREALKALAKEMASQAFLKGDWTYVEFTFDKPIENSRHQHGLGFMPRDFIQTYFSGTGTVLINWGLTDRQFLDLTATGACTVRGFLGAHA
jgi:hypothetical protein